MINPTEIAPRSIRRTDELDPVTVLFSVRHDWWDQAACRDPSGSLSGLFFSDELHDIARAKQVCADCPVLALCLEGALERREPWGVWGGELFLAGVVIPRKRPRGRPRKDAAVTAA